MIKYKFFGKIFSILLACCWMGAFTGCTDEIGDAEINVIQGSADTVGTVVVAEGLIKDAMYLMHDSREHKYQYQFNLHIDNYAGYLCVANSLQGRLPSTYYINPSFQSGPLANMLWVARSIVPVINSADILDIPELGAMANIMFCFAASELVDVHGPMPYFAFKRLQQDPPVEYDSVSVVYKDIIKELTKSQKELKEIIPQLNDEQRKRIKAVDRIAGGELVNWVRFANTLRLRMAMRMVKIAPELAREEAEAAFADGVLDGNDVDIELDLQGGRHPLYTISIPWSDTRLNASFENILKRYNNPLLKAWFSPCSPGLKNKNNEMVVGETETVYMGVRSGTGVHAKEERTDTYLKFSAISSSYGQKNVAILKASESLFLCAEGKLRGWNTGSRSAKSYYYDAVIHTFKREGFSEAEAKNYLKQRTPLDIPYKDLWDERNNYDEDLVSVGVRWIDSASDEEKLEQIITQKYIANYPLSLESWSEYRRTGYPKLIPVVYDAGDGSIPDGEHIRRIPFNVSGSVNIDDVINSAIPRLRDEDTSGNNGDDVQSTRIWWDVKATPNI